MPFTLLMTNRLLLFLAFFAASSGKALDLPVAADAHVGASATAAGTLPNLAIGGGSRALLRFHLAVLPPNLSPSQVVKATLMVHVNRVSVTGAVRVAQLSGPFDEIAVTQGTAPPAGAAVAQFTPVQGLNLIDITSTVQQWVTSPGLAFGLDLSADPSGAASLLVDSRENTATSFPAEIRLVLSGPAGPQGAMGPTGATGATGPASAMSQPLQAGLCDFLRTTNRPVPPGLDCSTKLVFVTNNVFHGDLGGVAGADAACNSEASALGRPGTYKAWVADLGSPSQRMTQANVPYVRADGVVVAYNWADLTDGSLHNPIVTTATGAPVATVFRVWTNVTPGGGATGFQFCGMWNSSIPLTGAVGNPLVTDGRWTSDGTVSCASQARLYCVQQ
ncbi:MAG: DNRLRE domain-containing protein [Acidobacteria bacterium]|nr:DNRLRE domain-containing protein [Acidobacteriota bacterium]